MNARQLVLTAAAIMGLSETLPRPLSAEDRPPIATSAENKDAKDADKPDAPEPTLADMFKQISTLLKHEGATKDGVMTITIPRDDLIVSVEGQDVPTGAGLESQFRFFLCSCGSKIVVVGSFVTADYEANDVVDALREGHLTVASVGPFLAYEQPRLTMVRFQGEAKPEELANTLKKTLEWVGEARGKPQKPAEAR